MFGKRKKQAQPTSSPPLRDHVLTGELPRRPEYAPGTATVALMELSMGGGLATVCSFVDGATSLYLSTGGGVIGVGEDPRANAASREFVAVVESALESLAPTDSNPDLDPGKVRFLLRVGHELFGVVYSESALTHSDHVMHALWVKGQDVLTWIRIVSQERSRD